MKAVILAAGESKRMNSKIPKVLYKICGKEIISYVIDVCKNAGIKEVIIVLGHEANLVKKNISEKNFGLDIKFVLQAERLGTGHAVMMAKDFFNDDEDILILYGDTPLIGSVNIKKFIEMHERDNNVASLISSVIDKPKGYGRILRRDNKFIRIVEDKDCDSNQALIKEINTGVYLFNGNFLKTALQMLSNNNAQCEYYLTDTLEIIKTLSDKIGIFCTDDCNEFLGVNNKIELEFANRLMRQRINKRHMESGVIIINTENTYIDDEVKIGSDSVIYPNVFLEGKTEIGKECVIRENSRIVDSQIFNNVEVDSSVILSSVIKSKVRIGPFAYIRPNCEIEEKVKIGDFVEIKNSNIDHGTKVAHLTYIGNADVGSNVNFGCGTTIANYDGKNKFKTEIGNNVFIGCNSNLVAPLKIGDGVYIAAGSTITDDIPEKNFAIARARQINKTDWTKKNPNA